MMRPDDHAHLAGLRDATASTLAAVIRPGPVALLDVPNQRNVGDSLIWAGTAAYLRRLGRDVRYAADLRGYVPADLRAAMPSGTVLVRGGGDFGDLWPGHQEHRERIVQDLPDYPVVQLPQSVWFGSADRAAQADRILGAHPDFTLLLRDTPSLARAAEQLPSLAARFCPDLALGWEPPRRERSVADTRRLLVLARADKETASGLHDVGPAWVPGLDADRTDWHAGGSEAWRRRAARTVTTLGHQRARVARRVPLPASGLANRPVAAALATINRAGIDAGVRLFAPARGAVVDRLHAHVMAALLGVEHVVLDNSYGKVRAVYDDYTGTFSTAHHASGLDEARELAARLWAA
ncbi:polysaccharide pyruvyl transferase family protein [Promicromonospora sp. NPDC052451]|uniref:polysaccharide pyruvyl transferase family protein n=1 Tax=unclassified Promicromonospora TaxID=2647929 RepID=UPI0037CA7AAE